jgi:hypothetical protein
VVPALPELVARHPGLTLELDARVGVVELSRREADLALRSVRPEGAELLQKRIVQTRSTVAGAPRYVEELGRLRSWSDARWVAWGEELAHLPQARWLAAHASGARVAMIASSFTAQLAAAEAGVGLVVLPRPTRAEDPLRSRHAMQQRFLQVAVVIAAIVLAVLGAHRLWQRSGSPSGELASALALPGLAAEGLAAEGMPSGLTDEPPGEERGGFFVADVTEFEGRPSEPEAPTSLSPPWPATFADDLCAGDEPAWATLSSLIDALGPDAAPDTEALEVVASVARAGCFTPRSERACAWAVDAIARGAPRAPFGWALLSHCVDDVALPLVDRVDAPGWAVLRFVVDREGLGRRPVRLPAYLFQSVELGLAAPEPARARFPFTELATALGHYDDPVATRALVAMYAVAPGYARETVGISIRFADDDRSRAIHQESCATVPAGSYVHACSDGSLDERVGSWAFDPHLEVARHPERRADVLAALERRAEGDDPLAGLISFRRLAELDRERASGLALGRLARARVPMLGVPAIADPPPVTTGLEEELRRFPTESALDLALRAAGIEGSSELASGHPVTVLETLAARGHAFGVDTESGTFPTPHDVLLRRLARLVAPALDDVVFEQIAPDEAQMAVGRYVLRAHRGGRVLETYARNYGDFYDVEAVVGLLNALLERRGALARCLVVPGLDGGDGVYFVCASAPQLTALRTAQLAPDPALLE